MSKELSQGAKGVEVARIQVALNAHQIPVTVNCKFDSATAKAVMQFQTLNDLKATGVVDEVTSALLFPFRTLRLSVCRERGPSWRFKPNPSLMINPYQPFLPGAPTPSPMQKPPERPYKLWTHDPNLPIKPDPSLMSNPGIPLPPPKPGWGKPAGIPYPAPDGGGYYVGNGAGKTVGKSEPRPHWVVKTSDGFNPTGAWPPFKGSSGESGSGEEQIEVSYRFWEKGPYVKLSYDIVLSVLPKLLKVHDHDSDVTVTVYYQILYVDPSELFEPNGWHLLNPYVRVGASWTFEPFSGKYSVTAGNQLSVDIIKDRLVILAEPSIEFTYDFHTRGFSFARTYSVMIQGNF